MSNRDTQAADVAASIDPETFEAIQSATVQTVCQLTKEEHQELFFEANINLFEFADEITERKKSEGKPSDVTRMIAVADAINERAIDLPSRLESAVANVTIECESIAAERELSTCYYGNCNGAATESDLTADWDGTKREIAVCPECYAGVEESEIPISDDIAERDPSDPPVEGVDEVRAHQQDGMAGVHHLRRDKRFVKNTLD